MWENSERGTDWILFTMIKKGGQYRMVYKEFDEINAPWHDKYYNMVYSKETTVAITKAKNVMKVMKAMKTRKAMRAMNKAMKAMKTK